MKKPPSIIGPAAAALHAMKALAGPRDRLAILLDGNPGVGKTLALDLLTVEICPSPHAVERLNGQSLTVDLVRHWKERAAYGNLFADWTIKRVDEIDAASSQATGELLTFLDYLPPRVAILASTNEFAKLQAASKGRLETRFHRFPVSGPSIDESTSFLRKRFGIPAQIAAKIALGAVPNGCLPSEGCNLRAAVKDAESYNAVCSATERRAA